MTDTPSTRASLLLRLRDVHDERAWSEFLAIYQPLVYRLARRWRFQDADAHELTQEVLMTVARALEQYDPERQRGSFRGWLFAIAKNLMINFLAKQKRLPKAGDSELWRLLKETPADSPEVSSVFDLEYRRQVFRWASQHIREEFQETTWRAFWLTCVEGHAIPDVAVQLDMTVGAIYIARSRVLRRLKATVQKWEQESP